MLRALFWDGSFHARFGILFFYRRAIFIPIPAGIFLPRRIPHARFLAVRDFIERAPGRDRCVGREQRIRLARLSPIVLFLDEQPIVPHPPAGLYGIIVHADERPAAVQPLPVENEFQVTFRDVAFRIVAIGRPGAAVPKLYRAAAILALRNRAFKPAIFQRMIFDLDRQTFGRGIERGDFRHGPRFQHPIEFEAKIVMQACRRVPLNDEAERFRLPARDTAPRLGRDTEIALGTIGF
jgi:hypothetical protein